MISFSYSIHHFLIQNSCTGLKSRVMFLLFHTSVIKYIRMGGNKQLKSIRLTVFQMNNITTLKEKKGRKRKGRKEETN